MANPAKVHRSMPWVWIAALLLIPGLFWGLAGYLSMGTYEARKAAIPVTATVEAIETKSRVSAVDRNGHPTEYQDRQQVKISFEMDDAVRRGALRDSHFDPDSTWLQYADFDRLENPAGSKVDVLVRRDLDYAATNASFTASYFLPILIASFGFALFVMIGIPTLIILLRNSGRSSTQKA